MLSIPQAEELSQCPGPRTPLIFQQRPRPRSGLDKTTQHLWLRGALRRHGLTQMDRWSLSDTHPQPVQGRPSQHTVPRSPVVNMGVPDTGAPGFTAQGPLQAPRGSHSAGLSAWSQHGPQETAACWPCPPCEDSCLVSWARRPQKKSSQSHPGGQTAGPSPVDTLPSYEDGLLHCISISYKGRPQGQGGLCLPCLGPGCSP